MSYVSSVYALRQKYVSHRNVGNITTLVIILNFRFHIWALLLPVFDVMVKD